MTASKADFNKVTGTLSPEAKYNLFYSNMRKIIFLLSSNACNEP